MGVMDGDNREQHDQPADRPIDWNDGHEEGAPFPEPDDRPESPPYLPPESPPESPADLTPNIPPDPPAAWPHEPQSETPAQWPAQHSFDATSTPPSDGSANWPTPPAAWGTPPSPPVPPPPVPRARLLLLWAVVLIIVGFIMTLPYLLSDQAIEAMPDGPDVNAGMTRFQGRYIVAMDVFGQNQPGTSSQILKEAETLADQSPTYTDYVKWVVVIAEIAGPEEAIWRLEALRSWEYDDDEIASLPLKELELVYNNGSAALDESQRTVLLDDLGWFGKLALSWDQADNDPLRQEVTWDATRTALVLVALALMGIGGVIVGLILLIVALVAAVNGSLRFKYDTNRPPTPNRLIYLEAVILFLLAMIAFDALLVVTQEAVPQWVAMQAVWLTLFIPLWVRLRGEPMGRLRSAIGWHRGRGVFREIGSGLVGYLAAIPLMGLGFGVTLLLMLLVSQLSADEWADATTQDTWRGTEQVAPSDKSWADPEQTFDPDDPFGDVMQEQSADAGESADQSMAIDNDFGPVHPLPFELADAGGLEFLFLMLLASLWAPIVEETIFRGMLQHHLRGYRGVVVSALIVGFIFAAIHPQGLMGIPVLMSVSVSLSIIREWRGSIIAPMTMHAVHNTLLLTMAVLAFG